MPCPSTAQKRSEGRYINLKALGWADRIDGLTLGPKALLLLLGRRSDDFGCSFYKQKILAHELGCSPRSVRDHVRVLENYGLVRVIGRLENFRQTSNVYHLVCWTGRSKLPATGHTRLGKYIKEPSYKDFLTALQRQILLHQQEKSADHNYNNEIITTLAEEEICETCLEALDDWVSPQERDLLREDCLTLLQLIDRGYVLDAHILPVLRRIAGSRRKASLIRGWHYFTEAIAEHRAEVDKEIKEDFRTAPPMKPVIADPKDNQARELLQQMYARSVGVPTTVVSLGGPA